jgi:hypothetical protein
MVERRDCLVSTAEKNAVLKVIPQAFHDDVSGERRGIEIEREERREKSNGDHEWLLVQELHRMYPLPTRL